MHIHLCRLAMATAADIGCTFLPSCPSHCPRTSARHAICQAAGSMQLEAITRRAVPSLAYPLSKATHLCQGTVSSQPEHPPAPQHGAS